MGGLTRGLIYGPAMVAGLMMAGAWAQAQTPGFNRFQGGGCGTCGAPRPVVRPPPPRQPHGGGGGRTVVVVPSGAPYSSSGYSSSSVTVGRNTVTYRESSSYRSSSWSGVSGSNTWESGVGWFPFGTGSGLTGWLNGESSSYGSGEAYGPYDGMSVGVDPTYAPDGMTPLAPSGGRPFYVPEAYVGAVPPGVPRPTAVLHIQGAGGKSTCHVTAQGAKSNLTINGVRYWCVVKVTDGKPVVAK